MFDKFTEKVRQKEALIGIVGLGYVGLPLMLRFAEVGFRVLGIDLDESKNLCIARSESYIKHIQSERLVKVKDLIAATSSFAKVNEVDAIILCLPTPLNKYREPDLSYVINTMDSLLSYLRPGQLLSLESTTYPGTTTEELKPRIESTGLTIGQDIFLVYSPEREDPGNVNYTTETIPKICAGDTKLCAEAGKLLYSSIINQVVLVSSTKVAEMTKLLENIHRSVNIGLVNEMKILADKMSIDIYEVIEAAATKPFGFVPYHPGPGIGGHCIPIDPFYLTWKAREYGLHTRFIELAGEINNAMPKWVVGKVANALNSYEKPLKNSNILILGIAYKRNVDDLRESPSIEILRLLHNQGAKVAYSDPHVPIFPPTRHYNFQLQSVCLNSATLQNYDCVVIATAHSAFDFDLIAEHAKLIIDTRGVFTKVNKPHIIRA